MNIDKIARALLEHPKIHNNLIEFAVAISRGKNIDENIVLDAVLISVGLFETKYIIKGPN